MIKSIRKWYPRKVTKNSHKIHGHVYVLKIRTTDYYKIGFSINDVSIRLAWIRSASPFEIDLVHAREFLDARKAEKYFHDHFKSKRVRGEWFTLTADDCEFILKYDEHS